MNELQRALAAFWGQFTTRNGMPVPAFLSGHVPDGTAFPYITYDAARPDALGATFLPAFAWFRREPGLDAQEQLGALMDQIAEVIPVGGTKLALPSGGFLLLYRNSVSFQEPYRDPEDDAIIGGRTSCEIKYYNM